MKTLLFGASGMLGQGVLRECLAAGDVERVQVVGRTSLSMQSPKLTEVVVTDLLDVEAIATHLQGFDACFFCLGVSSSGLDETAYTRVTFDLTLAVARTLARLNPAMTFVYVSGAGTDSSERGRSMWARVKGRTENALLQLPFKTVWLFRPGVIVPLHGARSKTRSYRVLYTVGHPLFLLARKWLPRHVASTVSIGRAMLAAARRDAGGGVLEAPAIEALAGPGE